MLVKSSPSDRATASRVVFQMLIEGAVTSIDIQTPYFLPDRSLRRALVRCCAARRKSARHRPREVQRSATGAAGEPAHVSRTPRRRRPHLRVPARDDARQGVDGGRGVGDHRHHKCGQPFVRAQRRSQRCISRARSPGACAAISSQTWRPATKLHSKNGANGPRSKSSSNRSAGFSSVNNKLVRTLLKVEPEVDRRGSKHHPLDRIHHSTRRIHRRRPALRKTTSKSGYPGTFSPNRRPCNWLSRSNLTPRTERCGWRPMVTPCSAPPRFSSPA